MKQEDLRKYLGKKIKINLKNGFFYAGEIKELREDSFLFIDKFQSSMDIAYSELALVQEFNGGGNHG